MHIELTNMNGTPHTFDTGHGFNYDCSPGGSWVRYAGNIVGEVRETPAEIAALIEAKEREAKFEERVHVRAGLLYDLWIKEEVDDPNHAAAYEEAIRFVAKGQAMIDAHAARKFAPTAPDAKVAEGGGE